MADTQSFNWQGRVLLPLVLLFAATLYWTVLPKLVHDWWDDPNFSHGFLVPFFTAWLIWERRAELRVFASRGSLLPGVFLILIGVGMLVVGKAGGEYFTMRSSLVFVTGGLFWVVFGREGFLLCLFPLVFLFFMVPIPYILYDAIAFPLKIVASWFAELSLTLAGVPVFRDGNIIHLASLQLEVADACSGIRSLVSLMVLATVAAYFFGLNVYRGVILLLSSVPVSVGTNSFRVFMTGIISNYYGSEYANGFFHDVSGWLIFLLGVSLLFFVGIVLAKVGVRGRNKQQKMSR